MHLISILKMRNLKFSEMKTFISILKMRNLKLSEIKLIANVIQSVSGKTETYSEVMFSVTVWDLNADSDGSSPLLVNQEPAVLFVIGLCCQWAQENGC